MQWLNVWKAWDWEDLHLTWCWLGSLFEKDGTLGLFIYGVMWNRFFPLRHSKDKFSWEFYGTCAFIGMVGTYCPKLYQVYWGYNPIVLVQDDEEWTHLIHGYSYMVWTLKEKGWKATKKSLNIMASDGVCLQNCSLFLLLHCMWTSCLFVIIYERWL